MMRNSFSRKGSTKPPLSSSCSSRAASDESSDVSIRSLSGQSATSENTKKKNRLVPRAIKKNLRRISLTRRSSSTSSKELSTLSKLWDESTSFLTNDNASERSLAIGNNLNSPRRCRRSCMKGSRLLEEQQLQTQQQSQKRSAKRKVRFGTFITHSNKVHKIQPLFEYKEELFWSKADQERMAQGPDVKSKQEMDSAQAYVQTYLQAMNQVFSTPDESDPQQAGPQKISAEHYEVLLLGRSVGFAGIEQYWSDVYKNRVHHRIQAVRVIVEAYDYYIENEFRQQEEATAAQGGTVGDVESFLRSFARSVTAADRYWAKVLGLADAQVAESIYETVRKKNKEQEEATPESATTNVAESEHNSAEAAYDETSNLRAVAAS